MSYLNADVPIFECLVRREFLYDDQKHHGEFERAWCFGIASVMGQAIGFHVWLRNGAMRWRLPIHALAWKDAAPRQELPVLELWDAFSYHVSVWEPMHLAGKRVRVTLSDGRAEHGTHMFIVDWAESDISEQTGDTGHKCAHVVRLDDGNFAAMPNNRVCAYDPATVDPFPADKPPDYLIETAVYSCEQSPKWTGARAGAGQEFFYEVTKDG